MWELVLALVVLVAFVFLLTNGMNDASAVVATMIACGAATPLQAVLWAASVGLVGAIFSGAAVAQTIIGLLDVPVSHQLLLVLLAGLTAAMLSFQFDAFLGWRFGWRRLGGLWRVRCCLGLERAVYGQCGAGGRGQNCGQFDYFAGVGFFGSVCCTSDLVFSVSPSYLLGE